MLLDNLFGSTLGIVWLLIFTVAILGLLIWLFIKKDEKCEEKIVEKVVEDKTTVNEEPIVENQNKVYEVVESDDGFFRVIKVGTERTLRKFSTKKEAEDYIKERN